MNERGDVTESCTANIAVRLDGQWWTPPLGSGCLPGIERGRLVADGELASEPSARRTCTAPRTSPWSTRYAAGGRRRWPPRLPTRTSASLCRPNILGAPANNPSNIETERSVTRVADDSRQPAPHPLP